MMWGSTSTSLNKIKARHSAASKSNATEFIYLCERRIIFTHKLKCPQVEMESHRKREHDDSDPGTKKANGFSSHFWPLWWVPDRDREWVPDRDKTLGECLVCDEYCFEENFASLFLAFQCQDGEDLLKAVNWSRLPDVDDILRRSPKCISYMGRYTGLLNRFKCRHGNTITKR